MNEIHVVENAGFNVEILIDDVQEFYENRSQESLLKNEKALACGATSFSIPTVQNYTNASMGGFFTYQEMLDNLDCRQVLYSNSISPHDVARLREVGCVVDDRYPMRSSETFPTSQLRLGGRVFRRQCSVCHTVEGTNGVAHLVGSWDIDQMRMNIAKLQQTKPFMPPFAGTAEELESLVQFICWRSADSPRVWPEVENVTVIGQIEDWLEEAGTEPGDFDRNHRRQDP